MNTSHHFGRGRVWAVVICFAIFCYVLDTEGTKPLDHPLSFIAIILALAIITVLYCLKPERNDSH